MYAPLTVIAATCILLVAKGSPVLSAAIPQMPEAPGSSATVPYRIQVGDVLRVTIIPQDQYSREVKVFPDGRIYYPLVGEIVAVGKTVTELTRVLHEALARELRGHRVSIEPIQISPVREVPRDPPGT